MLESNNLWRLQIVYMLVPTIKIDRKMSKNTQTKKRLYSELHTQTNTNQIIYLTNCAKVCWASVCRKKERKKKFTVWVIYFITSMRKLLNLITGSIFFPTLLIYAIAIIPTCAYRCFFLFHSFLWFRDHHFTQHLQLCIFRIVYFRYIIAIAW